jgi:hypothetical protein
MNKKPKATVPNNGRKNHSLALCKIPAVENKGVPIISDLLPSMLVIGGDRMILRESIGKYKMHLGIEDRSLRICLLESSIALRLA